jgi:hypothetical protein
MNGVGREWGDGATSQAEHVISDLSFEGGWATCICSGVVSAVDNVLTLEDAWDVHRGRPDLVFDRRLNAYYPDLATDEEVSDFLSQVERGEL